MSESPLELVRKRPGMYVGGLDSLGLRSLLYEVTSNALDEHLAGRATRISVVIEPGNGAIVEDDGGGMRWDEVDGVSFIEKALTTYHDAPTLDGHKPHAHIGSRGVGVFVVNALSSFVEVDSWREGRHFSQRYVMGVPQAPSIDEAPSGRRGTRLRYSPDPAFFADAELDFEQVRERLEEISLVNPGLEIDLTDERRRHVRFVPHEGLVTAVGGGPEAISLRGAHEGVTVDVALRWDLESDEPARVRAFANGDVMRGGGSHQRGMILGLANAIFPDLSARRRHGAAVVRALQRGLVACVHVTLRDPKFETPTRAILESPEAKRAVEQVVSTLLPAAFDERPKLHAALRRRVGAERAARGPRGRGRLDGPEEPLGEGVCADARVPRRSRALRLRHAHACARLPSARSTALRPVRHPDRQPDRSPSNRARIANPGRPRPTGRLGRRRHPRRPRRLSQAGRPPQPDPHRQRLRAVPDAHPLRRRHEPADHLRTWQREAPLLSRGDDEGLGRGAEGAPRDHPRRRRGVRRSA